MNVKDYPFNVYTKLYGIKLIVKTQTRDVFMMACMMDPSCEDKFKVRTTISNNLELKATKILFLKLFYF